ncbi:hypothetical protein BGZ49_004172 [Haplosporangium sp. Z 27]|nr:hypothetical protein BGZ49_004172 [Haplosporangium sp. Z 27]
MYILNTLSIIAIALATIASSLVEASPIPDSNAVSTYVPVNERKYTAEQLDQHERILKRSSSGYNDWSCVPSKTHPRPVILVHGLIRNGWDNWLYMGPKFAASGYCTYSLTYGQMPGIPILAGLDKIENSAQQLSTFVDKVLAATNTTKVNLVGHSQGSLMPRYYLKFLGGASKVDKYAAFGSVVYGITLDPLVPLLTSLGLYDTLRSAVDPACLSCSQIIVGSSFLQNLNAGGDTVPGVTYKFMVTEYDEFMTPYTNGFLRDKNPLVSNVVLQNLCIIDLDDHIDQMSDPIVFHEIDAFFNPAAIQTVNCLSAFY